MYSTNLKIKLTEQGFNEFCVYYLTHWDRDKIASISQTTFSNAFQMNSSNDGYFIDGYMRHTASSS